jgi:hypothetical protein
MNELGTLPLSWVARGSERRKDYLGTAVVGLVR